MMKVCNRPANPAVASIKVVLIMVLFQMPFLLDTAVAFLPTTSAQHMIKQSFEAKGNGICLDQKTPMQTRLHLLPKSNKDPVPSALDATLQPPSDSSPAEKSKKRMLLIWVHSISIFVVVNYFNSALWPAFLEEIPLNVWNLIHGLAGMTFAGATVTTTLLEWGIPQFASDDRRMQDLLAWLWNIESRLVLPAVSVSLLSGVAQSFLYYDTLRHAPFHVKSALHVMFLFGLWWQWTDYRSQARIQKSFDMSELLARRPSNIVSCLFVLALYSIMILKPST